MKFLKGKEQNLWRFFEAKKLGPEMDLIIDVSGFSLGDRWSIKTQEGYLDSIRLAKNGAYPYSLCHNHLVHLIMTIRAGF